MILCRETQPRIKKRRIKRQQVTLDKDGNVTKWKQKRIDKEMEGVVCDSKVNRGLSFSQHPAPVETSSDSVIKSISQILILEMPSRTSFQTCLRKTSPGKITYADQVIVLMAYCW